MNPKNSTLVTRDIYMSVDGAKVLGEHLSIALVVKLLLDSSVTTRCNESASRDRDAGRKHHNGFDRKGGRCRCLMMRHHLGKVSHGPRCEIENLSIILAAVATTLHCELRIMFDDPKHVSVACLRLVRDKQQRCCCGIPKPTSTSHVSLTCTRRARWSNGGPKPPSSAATRAEMIETTNLSSTSSAFSS